MLSRRDLLRLVPMPFVPRMRIAQNPKIEKFRYGYAPVVKIIHPPPQEWLDSNAEILHGHRVFWQKFFENHPELTD